jgi:hypothetical protein
MRDPDNTIAVRNRLETISAASQLRLCCKAQLGFSVVQLGIPRSENYAAVLGGCSW